MYYTFQDHSRPPCEHLVFRFHTELHGPDEYGYSLGASSWEALLGARGPYLWTMEFDQRRGYMLDLRYRQSLNYIGPLTRFLYQWLLIQGFISLNCRDYLQSLAREDWSSSSAQNLLEGASELSRVVFIARTAGLAARDITRRSWTNPVLARHWANTFYAIIDQYSVRRDHARH
jgi:hypothetical protein